MNCKESEQSSLPKLAFKAVENFLRRISFNLGNTPSETEVKIVSCIPVDVSDLQAKILCLEKELETHKQRSQKLKNTAVHTSLINPYFYTDSMATQPSPEEQYPHDYYHHHSKRLKEKTSYPASGYGDNRSMAYLSDLAYDVMGIPEPRPRRRPNHPQNHSPNRVQFPKEQQMYYSRVQTPIQNYENDWNCLVEHDMMKRVAANKMNPIFQDISNRTPILSRNNLTYDKDSICDSDLCLRPNGNIVNIDNERLLNFDDATVTLTPASSQKGLHRTPKTNFTNEFYNDRYYDLIPIKIDGKRKIKKHERENVIADLMEELAMNQVNITSVDKSTDCRNQERQEKYREELVLNDILKRSRNTDEDISKCSQDCGTSKQMNKNREVKPKSHKNVTTNHNSNIQRMHLNDSVKRENKTKTDDTLNEIKTILKSVVNLVKRHSSRTVLSRKPRPNSKKDAMVQKDLKSRPIGSLQASIGRPRFEPPQFLQDVNFSPNPNYPSRFGEPYVAPCYILPQHNPYYCPVEPRYQIDPRSPRFCPYH